MEKFDYKVGRMLYPSAVTTLSVQVGNSEHVKIERNTIRQFQNSVNAHNERMIMAKLITSQLQDKNSHEKN